MERLFSFAGMVRSPKRTQLLNAHLEQLVLLKSNGYASEKYALEFHDIVYCMTFMTLYFYDIDIVDHTQKNKIILFLKKKKKSFCLLSMIYDVNVIKCTMS